MRTVEHFFEFRIIVKNEIACSQPFPNSFLSIHLLICAAVRPEFFDQ